MADSNPSIEDLRLEEEDRRDLAKIKTRRRIRLALVLLLVAIVATMSLRTLSAPAVKVATAEEIVASNAVLQASGYVTARRKATVSSKFTGKVTEVLVEEGLKVTDGQILARLDDSQIRRQAELDEARLTSSKSALREIEVRLAEAELNQRRSQELVASGVAAQSQLDADRAASDSLRARLAAARDEVTVAERGLAVTRQQIDDSVIRAPFTGVAVSKDAQPGEMISPVSAGGGFTRTGICTLVDMSSLEIEVDVNEAYINRVRQDQPVEAVLDSYPDWKIPGKVITPVPTADRQKATVTVRIAFEQLDPRILPDMGVKVSFLDAEAAAAPARTVVRIPCKAVVGEGAEAAVFQVEQSKVTRRSVQLSGKPVGDECDLASGLAKGAVVVVEPGTRLADGMRVRVAPSKG